MTHAKKYSKPIAKHNEHIAYGYYHTPYIKEVVALLLLPLKLTRGIILLLFSHLFLEDMRLLPETESRM
jgi:hypothetical protein